MKIQLFTIILQLLKTISSKSFLLFRIGTLLLVSAPAIASIFFLLTLFFAILRNPRGILINKWNLPLFIISFFLVISVLLNNTSIEGWNDSLNLAGLGNWIPYFICFFAFQNYTNSYEYRKQVIYSFLLGSFPLLFSIFSQYFLNWNGPFGILNNLIIWYQRPTVEGHGISGLFNNSNYTGSWLLIIWPMSLVYLKKTKLNIVKKFLLFIFIFSIFFSILLSRSRNTWIGGFISLPFIGKSYLIIFIALIILFLLLISYISFQSFLPLKLQLPNGRLIPNLFKEEFVPENVLPMGLENIFELTRIKIWIEGINLIIEKPLIGWGAASFPILFTLKNENTWYGHSHNLFLDLSISYGLPVGIIFLTFVIFILYKSFLKIYSNKKNKKDNSFDKAWWTASFTLFVSQMFDIQYFDIRIGITAWIFLAGLVSINRDKNYL